MKKFFDFVKKLVKNCGLIKKGKFDKFNLCQPKMLKKKNRLRKKKEIERVFKEGKSFREDFLILKKIENELEESRFCFVVPQNVSKKATIRNKIKRRMREVIRQMLSKIKSGFDIVLIALPEILAENFNSIKKKTEKILKKANLLK